MFRSQELFRLCRAGLTWTCSMCCRCPACAADVRHVDELHRLLIRKNDSWSQHLSYMCMSWCCASRYTLECIYTSSRQYSWLRVSGMKRFSNCLRTKRTWSTRLVGTSKRLSILRVVMLFGTITSLNATA